MILLSLNQIAGGALFSFIVGFATACWLSIAFNRKFRRNKPHG